MQRKLRIISGSLIVTVLRLVYDLYGFKDGDLIEILPIGASELRLRKIKIDIFNLINYSI